VVRRCYLGVSQTEFLLLQLNFLHALVAGLPIFLGLLHFLWRQDHVASRGTTPEVRGWTQSNALSISIGYGKAIALLRPWLQGTRFEA